MSYAALGAVDAGCFRRCPRRSNQEYEACVGLCQTGPLTASADPSCYQTCPQGSFEEYADCVGMCRGYEGGFKSKVSSLLRWDLLGVPGQYVIGGAAVAGVAAFLLLRRKKR